MEISISKDYRSPHFENQFIPVEFIVLHYTAQSFKKSLEIFLDSRSRSVSCHLLVDEKGKIYELVSCWEGNCKKAFHAGKSVFKDTKGESWQEFNNFSIGIELVNWNGNFFTFTEDQYTALFSVLNHLKRIYPALQNPDRILGHEHIASFRGKKDPGCLFNWEKLFKKVYLQDISQKWEIDFKQWLKERQSVWTKKQCQSLGFLKSIEKWNDEKAKRISLIMEMKGLSFFFKKILLYFVFKLF